MTDDPTSPGASAGSKFADQYKRAGARQPFDRLPLTAQERVTALGTTLDEIQGKVQLHSDAYLDLRDAKMRAHANLRDLESFGRSVRYEGDEDKIASAKNVIAEIQATIDHRAALGDALGPPAQALGSLFDRLERYVAKLPRDRAIALYEPGKATAAPKAANIQSQIEKLREQRLERLADIESARRAPIHSTVAKQKARAEVENLAKQGRPDLLTLIERGGSIVWPAQSLELEVGYPTTNLAAGEGDYGTALVAWLFQKELTAAIEAEITLRADDKHALSPDDRLQCLADLEIAVLQVERAEVALIDLGARQGLQIIPRSDTDPRAYLNLADTLPAPSHQG